MNQAVAHGLGETPKAIVLWTNAKTSETLGAGYAFALGFTDTTTSKSVAGSSADNVGTTSTSRRFANNAITIVDSSATTLAEADLNSVDATNFTLRWTTNNATAYVIHFIAIGGSRVSAKALGWTMPTSTGNKAVTGVGFKPELVISANMGAGFTSTPPASGNGTGLGLSSMDEAGHVCTTAGESGSGLGTTDAQRYERTDKVMLALTTSGTISKEASWVSMDSDGFTVNYSTANSSAGQMISLALAGLQAHVGSFTKATGGAPASQVVTGVGFRPRVVLLASMQSTASTSTASHYRFGIGATDGTTEGCAALQDTDALTTSSVDGVDKTSKVFVKVNNNTRTVDAEADTTSLDSDGFTLSWTTNDAVATELCYVAIAQERRVVVVGTRGGMDAAAPEAGSGSPPLRRARPRGSYPPAAGNSQLDATNVCSLDHAPW